MLLVHLGALACYLHARNSARALLCLRTVNRGIGWLGRRYRFPYRWGAEEDVALPPVGTMHQEPLALPPAPTAAPATEDEVAELRRRVEQLEAALDWYAAAQDIDEPEAWMDLDAVPPRPVKRAPARRRTPARARTRQPARPARDPYGLRPAS